MEDLENREQPKMLETNPVGVNQNIENESIENKNVESVVEEQTNGSLGKFKDAESLLTAYNNLQAEFTRKCQKLKEFEKNEMQTPTLFEKEDWQKEVVKFLNDNIEAKPYSKEISEILMNDKELAKKSNALDIAWAKVIQKTYKKPDEVLNNEYIESYLNSNEEIKNKLLLDAMKNVKNTASPKVMGTTSGSISMPATVAPKTIQEAKLLAMKFFE